MSISRFNPMIIGTSVFIFLFTFTSIASLAEKQAPFTDENINNNDRIHIVGRYQSMPESSIAISYPGVSIEFNVSAKKVNLEAKSNSGNGSLDVLLDGKLSHTIYLTQKMQSYPIFFSETAKSVHIKIVNRSETWQSVNRLKSLVLESGELLAPSRLPKRKLLIVGDSVTCGSGVSRGAQCDTHIRGHDAINSYGMRLGQLLDANVHLVCFGGRGIVRSWDENPDDLQAPAFFDLSIPVANRNARWSHQQYQPDLVLVSLGTNDFNPGVPEQSWFESSYIDFIKQLKKTHPNAKVAVTEGAMLNDAVPEKQNKSIIKQYLTNIISAINLPDVSYIPSQHYPGDACDPHPTGEQHNKMALDLADELRKLLNW